MYATRTLYVPGEYATIQAAIDASVPGDEILVADGTYSGTGNKNLDYHGKPITVRSASGNPAVCIIDCQGNGRGFYFHSRETAAAVVDGFTIRNGHVTDSSAGQVCGGGVYCTSSSPTLTNCAIIANTASSPHSLVYGGGVYCCFSSATLTDCTISGNDASSGDYVAYGGGVYCSFSSNPILTNCRISGNRASAPAYVAYGGGVYCGDSSNPSVTNCTITGNKALAVSGSAFGGGVACDWDSSPTLTSCILWGDTPQETYVASGTPVVTYCDIQGSYAGVGNINLNPLFFDPDGPDNNPNTWQDNDYRLSPGSPCIDAGKNSAVPAGVTTDLDGHPRFADDPASPDCRYAPGTCGTPPIVDMGAYELIPAPPIPGDLDGDYDVDGADFAVFLAAYGRCTGYPLYNAAADLNGDGCVTLVDYQQWLQAYRDFNGDPFAPPPQPSDLGDVNGDGAVNGIDVQAFVEVLLNPGEATLRERFVTDFNGDGESDAADVAGFVQVLVAK